MDHTIWLLFWPCHMDNIICTIWYGLYHMNPIISSNLKYICPSTVPYWFSFKYFLIPFCHRASSIAWINILLIAPPLVYAMVSNWAVTSSGVSTTKPSLFCLLINGLEFVFASALNAYGSQKKALKDFSYYTSNYNM